MKNQTFTIGIALLCLSFIAVNLLYSTNVRAQEITPETKCYNKKLKASGSYVRCLLRAEVNANRNMTEASEEDVTSCHERFEERYNRAEAQATDRGASCPSHGGLASYQQTIVGATSTINSNNDVKQLAITIDLEDLAYVMDRSLNLNIAIKVNGVFNVIWRSISTANLNQFMEFQWSPVFHVFGASSPEPSSTVDIKTNVVDIALGQDVVLDTNNILNTAVAGNTPTGITFINDSDKPTNAALAQQLTYNGASAITPIYNGNPLLSQQSELITPTQEVLLWFESNTKTGDIFTIQPSALSTTLNFTNQSTAQLLFSNMQWSAQQN